MRYPVIDHECCTSSIEVTVIEDQEVFVLVCQALNRMGFTLGKIPDVALVQCFHLVATILVNGRDDDLAFVHEAPFRLADEQYSRLLAMNLRRGANATPGSHPFPDVAEHWRCRY